MSRRAVMRAKSEAQRNPMPAFVPVPVVTSSPRLAFGTCPKCLVHYGRAMRGHAPYCNGDPNARPRGVMPSAMINNGRPVTSPVVVLLNPKTVERSQLPVTALPVQAAASVETATPAAQIIAPAKRRGRPPKARKG